MTRAPLSGVDCLILAGGLGTRIAAVLGETPKVLAPIGGVPFLELLLDQLTAAGVGRVVLSLGHLAEVVIAHLRAHPRPGLEIAWSVETTPLGTAGGIRLARPLLTSDPVLILNGDSWTGVDPAAFVAAHADGGAMVTMLCVEVPDCARYGRVELDHAGGVRRFAEKDPAWTGPGLINAGAYLFSSRALDRLAASEGPALERDFLQTLPSGSLVGYVTAAEFIDIGTPASLAEAPQVLGRAR
jgi:NDP-sugar pyrophosphorylase family protein